MNTRKTLTILCVLVLAAWAAAAERPVHQSAAAAANGTVEINNVAGSITVEGWSRDEVELSGNVSDAIEKVEFETSGDRTTIEVKYPHHTKNGTKADIKVMVPEGSEVEIEAVSASVEVRGVSGGVDAESVSGDITIEDGLLTGGDFQTVSGAVDLSVAFDRGHVEMESMSGDLTLALPSSTAADFELETFSGSITNELSSDLAKRSDDHGPGRELDFSTGSGGPKIEMTSFSGSVTLKGK